MRRNQDSINPRTHGDVMVLSHDESEESSIVHPYWYARIIGIFHAMVVHKTVHNSHPEPRKMEFLFVRWFGLDTSERSGWKAKKCHQIGFIQDDNPGAFGFLDPADVIRAVHLLPRFVDGRTGDFLGHSLARSAQEKNKDWVRYYVNM